MRGRTTFIIAHRLSTVKRADRILVIQAGRIVEEGTHSALLRTHGQYYHMYTRQFRRELERQYGIAEPEPVDLGEILDASAGTAAGFAA